MSGSSVGDAKSGKVETRVPSSPAGREVATVLAGEGDLVGLKVVRDGESLMAHGTAPSPLKGELPPNALEALIIIVS